MPTKAERALARVRKACAVLPEVDVDWVEVEGVARDSYCMVAPKTVVAALRGSR